MQPSWDSLAPHLDDALAELPEGWRIPVILHYLQGGPYGRIASELGVSRSTAPRRVEAGAARLCHRLKRMGVVVSVGALAELLADNAICPVPATLQAGLLKLAIAGVGGDADQAG